MLAAIQPIVARYAEIIATVTGIDVEVIDVELVRIAGTGLYAAAVGRSIREKGEIYRHVMRIKRPFFLDNPKEHPLCQHCSNHADCYETLSLCMPILDLSTAGTTSTPCKIAGIIGLVCFTQAERERILAQRDIFTDLLAHMAEFIGHKLAECQQLTRAEKLIEFLLHIVDHSTYGVIVLNAAGKVRYMNALARRKLSLPTTELPATLTLSRTWNQVSDQEEIKFIVDGRQLSVCGQLTDLTSADPQFARVLVFETIPRLSATIINTPASIDRNTGLDAILGKSQAIQKLKELIGRVAASTSTICITGESGTGKELVAQAIHRVSNRANGPFMAINCSAIPDQLLESELFGYARGAFTGANHQGRIGRIELAQGGVLFLDEVGSLPLSLQAKFLRVLQERQLTRLGSNHNIVLDIRIIAATNDDLPGLIRQGRFREDLYYRLHVIPLTTPPLRERTEDIGILTKHFLAGYAARFGKVVPAPDDTFITALTHYPWPGNVRELENALEFLVNVLPKNSRPQISLLPPALREALSTLTASPSIYASTLARLPTLPTSKIIPTHNAEPQILPLAELERRAIASALYHCGPRLKGKQAAATALGISLATLYRKCKSYGLNAT
ncbi:Fis family transcriptional [Desulfovibrionales bacterium]